MLSVVAPAVVTDANVSVTGVDPVAVSAGFTVTFVPAGVEVPEPLGTQRKTAAPYGRLINCVNIGMRSPDIQLERAAVARVVPPWNSAAFPPRGDFDRKLSRHLAAVRGVDQVPLPLVRHERGDVPDDRRVMRQEERLVHVDGRRGENMLEVDPFVNGDHAVRRYAVMKEHLADGL